MMAISDENSRKKMSAYRKRLRAAGLRPVQIWVPDVRSPRVIAEARRQSKLVSRRKSERDDIDFIEALQADNLWLPQRSRLR